MKIVKKLVISVLTLLVCVSVLPVGNVSALTLTNSKYAKTNTRYRGYLGQNSSAVYRFTLDRAKKVKIKFNANGANCALGSLLIYNGSGDQIWNTDVQINNTIGSKTTIYTHYLTKGTYYFVINNDDWWYHHGGNYYWEYSASALSRISQGIHNDVTTAVQFPLGKDTFDLLGISNKKNVLKFNIIQPGYYQLYGTTSCDHTVYYEVFDSAGNKKYDGYADNDNPIGRTAFSKRMRLTKGRYYLVFETADSWGIGYVSNGLLKFRVKKL